MREGIGAIHKSLVVGQYELMVEQIDEYGPEFWEDYKGWLISDLNRFMPSYRNLYVHFTDATISYFRIKGA